MKPIAEKFSVVPPSLTVMISGRAIALKEAGQDVIMLSVGEPDFSTPTHVKLAAIQAICNNYSYYTAVTGLSDLRKAIVAKFKRDNQLDYDMSQILVSSGAKQSLYNAFQALLNPSDEVIIPAPYWVSYPHMARLAGAKPVMIDTNLKQNYKITPEQLDDSINEKTKLFIICSPSNPTGMVYSHGELQALAKVLVRHPHVYVISDDIYEYIYWGQESFSNILMQCPELYSRTIVVNGVSKAYAMTGWRIGYAAANIDIIKTMTTLQSHSSGNATAVAQVAARAAIEGSSDCVTHMVEAYKKRQQIALSYVNQIDGFSCATTEGAFYLFVDVTDVINKLGLKDDFALAELLLDKASVAVVPGVGFGLANHIRISYAIGENRLIEALMRIKKVINRA